MTLIHTSTAFPHNQKISLFYSCDGNELFPPDLIRIQSVFGLHFSTEENNGSQCTASDWKSR